MLEISKGMPKRTPVTVLQVDTKPKKVKKPNYGAGPLGRCLRSLDTALRAYGHVDKDQGKKIGEATYRCRRDILRKAMKDLHEMGYRIPLISGFRRKHITALVNRWIEEGHSYAYIDNKLGTLRVMSRWIGKQDLIGPTEEYLADSGIPKRTYYTKNPKGWAESEDASRHMEKMHKIYEEDPNVHYQMLAMVAFGLRKAEAAKFKPHLADLGDYIDVQWGTKGGRKRNVPITTEVQRAVLDYLKSKVATKSASLIPAEYGTYRAWLHHMNYVVRKCGVTRKDGCTLHGLRHSYAVMMYEAIAESPAPCKGAASVNLDIQKALKARTIVAQCLGHSRPKIATGYVGEMFKIAQAEDAAARKKATMDINQPSGG